MTVKVESRESRATEIALVKQALVNISSKLNSIEQQLETKYAQATELALVRLEISELRRSSVTQDQFGPIRMAVYGAIGLILTGSLIAIMKFG